MCPGKQTSDEIVLLSPFSDAIRTYIHYDDFNYKFYITDYASILQLPTSLAFNRAPLLPLLDIQSLELVLDSSLSIETQVTVTVRSTFYHLRLLRQLDPYLET